ncbi:unnamed protein product [Penicillium olsonii]|uniref:Uncharacterized protein n=1 Tax=Penicillium olsonii TaxID=99116 RepID=A0A9W4H9I3_PENOL|nr:unnamed protein product [Penicillium olsonii]CAG8268470.1 unnamed protein product [Penicillium olsonii]
MAVVLHSANVSSGAVQRGQEGNQVDDRMARCSYGVHVRQKAKPEDHCPEIQASLQWCPYEEGMPLNASDPISFPFYRVVSQKKAARGIVFHEQLLFNQAPTAPETFDQNTAKLCELEADLSKIPVALFDKKKNSKGQTYYRVAFELVLIPSSATLVFELQFNGISYGMVRSRY